MGGLAKKSFVFIFLLVVILLTFSSTIYSSEADCVNRCSSGKLIVCIDDGDCKCEQPVNCPAGSICENGECVNPTSCSYFGGSCVPRTSCTSGYQVLEDASCEGTAVCCKKNNVGVCPGGEAYRLLPSNSVFNVCGNEDCENGLDSDSYRREPAKDGHPSKNELDELVQSNGYDSGGENIWKGVCLSVKGKVFNYEEGDESEIQGSYSSYKDVLASCVSDGPGISCVDVCDSSPESLDPNGISHYVFKFFLEGFNKLFSDDDYTHVIRVQCPNMGVCKDGACLPCNNNAVCEPLSGETEEGCCDCKPCSDSCRLNQLTCTGNINNVISSATSGPICGWCPPPNSPAKLSYDVPGQSASGSYCVDLKIDPFNCGECGFPLLSTDNAALNTEVLFSYINNNNKGLCFGEKPFCAGGVCVGFSDLTESQKNDIEKYTTRYKDDLVFNNLFKPYSPEEVTSGDAEGSWKSQNFGSVFKEGKPDHDETACEFGGGTLDEELGCCGDRKCRADNNKDFVCGVTSYCDGSEWHKYDDVEGEVYLPSDCYSPYHMVLDEELHYLNYPVAAVGGSFAKCVDEDHVDKYANALAGSSSGCIPDFLRYGENPVSVGDNFPDQHYMSNSAGVRNSIRFGQGQSYICPENFYIAAHNSISEATQPCRLHSLDAEGDGLLICTGTTNANMNSMFGFASIIEANSGDLIHDRIHWPVFGASGSGRPANNLYGSSVPFCPAPIDKWVLAGGDVVNSKAVVSCPGSIPVSNLEGSLGLAAYGTGTYQNMALFCSDDHSKGTLGDLNFMNYFRGDGSVMGNVSGNGYACFTDLSKPKKEDSSRAFVGICCGSAGCSNIPGSVDSSVGKKFKAGEYYNTSNGFVYCLANGNWGFDLDSVELQDTCKSSGFSPSGTFCCSEGDDKRFFESYNDKGGLGACFLGEYQRNNQFVSYNRSVKSDLFVFNGSILGCGNKPDSFVLVNVSNRSVNVPYVLDNPFVLADWPNPGAGGNYSLALTFNTGLPLVNNVDFCHFVNDSSLGKFCSLNGSWSSANGYTMRKSVVPTRLLSYLESLSGSSLSSFGCCKSRECFDPSSNVCSSSGTHLINDSFFYQCIAGSWVNVYGGEKLTPDGCYSGFCPETSDCVFDLYGNPDDNYNPSGSPVCLADGQFKGSFVCVNGSWDSRIRLLGVKLAAFVGSDDYSLSCSPLSDVLVSRQNPGLSDYFCSLSFGNKRVLGALVNQPLVSSDYSGFADALKQSFWLSYPSSGAVFDPLRNCSNSSTNYSLCMYAYSTTPARDLMRFYYDKPYGLAIITDSDISLSLGRRICDSLPSWLSWLCPSDSGLKTVLSGVGVVERIYSAKTGSKQVFGFASRACSAVSAPVPAYWFNYSGISQDSLFILGQGVSSDGLNVSNGSIRVLNPRGDVWNSLSLLKYK
jgi:hypothetical protein